MKAINIFRILACTAAMSLSAACYDDAKIWDEFEDVKGEISQLQSRIEALEKSVADDVAALQSMISVGSIASWTYNAETGNIDITLPGYMSKAFEGARSRFLRSLDDT